MNNYDSYQIDKDLQPVLRQVETNGVKIDIEYLKTLSLQIEKKINTLTSKIYRDLGCEVNLNSPSQLAQVLYKKLNIQAQGKKGKTHHSTSARALEKIRSEHPAVEKILMYRELAKLKSTYIDPLPKKVDVDQRLHTHYAVDTATGRLSSKDPNLQNIPIRTQEGKKIRKAFVAKKGYKLIKADYSQIELRIVAHMANDANMIEIFKHGRDIHSETAKRMCCDRRMAKVINFGVLYGMSAYGLSETLKIPVNDAQDFIDKYFQTYSGAREYFDQIIENAKKVGYVKTMFGRKREIRELISGNKYLYNFGIRTAINTPIQGTAADIIKLAMLALQKNIDDFKISKKSGKIDKFSSLSESLNHKCQIILQVHDELVFEVKKSEVKKYVKIIKENMENVIKLKVPLEVKLEVGDNWAEMEKISL